MTDLVLNLLPNDFPDAEDGEFVNQGEQYLVLSGGCFWCTEAVYRQLKGVLDVTSGYAGDSADTANYDAVCSGKTNHAEAIRIKYDSNVIGPSTLLKVFFGIAHDPTQLDRQGNDIGRQYRSAIFYQNAAEQQLAQRYIQLLEENGALRAPIVTCIEPLSEFFPAEHIHQNYAAANQNQPYIAAVAQPKVAKVQHYFRHRLKKDL